MMWKLKCLMLGPAADDDDATDDDLGVSAADAADAADALAGDAAATSYEYVINIHV